jgi:fatty acid desaturase
MAVSTTYDRLSAREGVLNLLRILLFHAGLAAWFVVLAPALAWPIMIPASILLCYIHQREISEWIHEAAHGNLIPSRTWNDRFANWLCGVFMLIPIGGYRLAHFSHHSVQRFFSPSDPDTALYALNSRRELWKAMLQDVIGWSAISAFLKILISRDGKKAARRSWTLPLMAVIQLIAFGGLLLLGYWHAYFIYYGTLVTVYAFLLSRFRLYGQHAEVRSSGDAFLCESSASRTIDAGLFDRILFTSRVMMYHHEHHLHPSLPYRALHERFQPTDDLNRCSRSRWKIVRAVLRGLGS